eukprot:TRINITY_DN7591_c0_g1_i2.p2 TRINITY_DN7591_c0_g1~~TRINITY_DN7591_c0_g1_i2.p2  ORF type:complete len:158 (-),score=46.16 TRINITY_DN7591_c0_g1_i2:14-487(-)
MPPAFQNKIFSVTGSLGAARSTLKALIGHHGGQVSNIVHSRVSYVVCNAEAVANNTQRVRKAARFAIPVVSEAFVVESAAQQKLLDWKPYALASGTSDAGAAASDLNERQQGQEQGQEEVAAPPQGGGAERKRVRESELEGAAKAAAVRPPKAVKSK